MISFVRVLGGAEAWPLRVMWCGVVLQAAEALEAELEAVKAVVRSRESELLALKAAARQEATVATAALQVRTGSPGAACSGARGLQPGCRRAVGDVLQGSWLLGCSSGG